MGTPDPRIRRILIVHPEGETRSSIRLALGRVDSFPLSVYEAASLTEGFQSVHRLDPHLVFLDLTEERALALRITREFRRPDRRIIGLYNPLLMRERMDDFFRAATRAGIGDFVPLPASEDELAAVLEAAYLKSEGDSGLAAGRMISWISPKGGVGTTTLAVNLALALAGSELVEGGVALCDSALQFGNAAVFLGLAADRDLADLARDLDDLGALSAYLCRHPQTGLEVLASPRDPKDAERIAPADMSGVLIQLCRSYGMTVVDCPPSIDLITLAALELSESIFVVTEAITPTVLATAVFLELLDEQGFGERIRVVLNRHSTLDGVLPERVVSEQLGRPLDHVLPEDRAAVTAASRGEPMVVGRRRAEFSKAVNRLAESLVRSPSGELKLL